MNDQHNKNIFNSNNNNVFNNTNNAFNNNNNYIIKSKIQAFNIKPFKYTSISYS